MHLPQNGPAPSPTAMIGDPALIADFRACAGTRYPNMANYSFDYDDVHFLCLDSNHYVDPNDKTLQDWIAADLGVTDARWKIAVYHHPAFNVGAEHHKEQQMRVLSPLLEAHGVDVCLHGHEHVYQRTLPLRFKPSDPADASPSQAGGPLVPGQFTVDTNFDGRTKTKPTGIIYITTGAGGKELYDPAYNARFFSRRHSLTVCDVDGGTLTLTQVDEDGKVRDRIQITKE